MPEKIIFAWSGGKDSALAFYELLHGNYEILALLTTLTEDFDRISMHGVRRSLLLKQAKAIGMPLEKMYIAKDSPCKEYQDRMADVLGCYKAKGVLSAAFGDVYLVDVRKYREQMLAKIGMKGIFPLWKRSGAEIAEKFIDLGFKAIIVCVDSKVLGKEFVGRIFDRKFLKDLPNGIDPCGENGEFHSFVFDGPIFKKPVKYEKGEIVLRDNRFYFCDLIPA
ncbi:MAG: diphthine--ammonia ligase [Candidatus Parcubacteria bacterium]|nr:diphthine--ammonia ligase [Candidatus Parcubacteria bacterium]